MVNVKNIEEKIVIEINGQTEELTIQQVGKLRDDLYKAVGIAFAYANIRKGQQALKDIAEGNVPKKGERWGDFQRRRNKEIEIEKKSEKENLEKLNSGEKISI